LQILKYFFIQLTFLTKIQKILHKIGLFGEQNYDTVITKQITLNNINHCWNTTITIDLETSCGQNYNLNLKMLLTFSTQQDIRHL
jgi:hypothetical protein